MRRTARPVGNRIRPASSESLFSKRKRA